MRSQDTIDSQNSDFWNELCGTNKAKQLKVIDRSPESLARFDDWYMSYYWYLYDWIPFREFKGKRVLEVGLGYGTVLQKIVEAGADYKGLDIAYGPVEMGNFRIDQVNGLGHCLEGSILKAPFEDESFDYCVSIGCLHHTGNIDKAISELSRVLHQGGTAIIMVYYSYSFRRWHEMWHATINQFVAEKLKLGRRRDVTEFERQRYDYDSSGRIAPETDFVSRAQLSKIAKRHGFKKIKQGLELLGEGKLTQKYGRERVLKLLAPIGGRHIYARLTK